MGIFSVIKHGDRFYNGEMHTNNIEIFNAIDSENRYLVRITACKQEVIV